jgi:hypothetical protein
MKRNGEQQKRRKQRFPLERIGETRELGEIKTEGTQDLATVERRMGVRLN